MRSKLLRSFLYVFGFWWVMATLWWSVSDPEVNLASLQRVHALLPFLPLNVPEGAVSVLDAWSMQKQVLLYWSIPVLLLSSVSGALGAAAIWGMTYRRHKERLGRESPAGKFRGVSITLGQLPIPKGMKREVLEIGAADADALSIMTEAEKRVLFDIIGIIAAHPEAYAGEGMGVSLMEHTLRVVEEALSSKNRPSLSALVAAAHETGKIVAYKKNDAGEWQKVKNQDREAARALATLDSWWAMPPEHRHAILYAVKYKSTPNLLPELEESPHIYKLAKDLLYRAAETTEKVATVAKARVLEKHELPTVALKGFLDALPTLPFQDGLPKGVKGVGWKVGTRVYLLEIKLRETIMAKLDPDIRGALEGAYKDRTKLATFTQELLKALDSKGWLIKEINKTKLEAKEALWTIKAGKFDYKGVIIIEIPQEYREVLPSKDSMYEITVQGPLFAQSAPAAFSVSDVSDLIGKPGPAKPSAASADAPKPAPADAPKPAAAQGAAGKAADAPAPTLKASDKKEFVDLGLFK